MVQPTHSVLIPAYGRAVSLERTLQALARIVNESVEVVVIDDASPSDDVRAACAKFSFAKYIRAPENLGVIGARNYGYQHLSGKYIINLDDDSYPTSSTFFSQIEEAFTENPKIGIVSLNINVDPERYYYRPDSKRFTTFHYTGCGNVWSQRLFETIGGYSPLFFRQGEELEHCLRAIDAGFDILATPEIIVRHDQSPINRHVKRNYAHEVANHLKRSVMRWPTHRLPEGLLRWVGLIAVGFHRIDFSELFREISHHRRGLLRALADRQPVRDQTFRRVRNLVRIEKLHESAARRR